MVHENCNSDEMPFYGVKCCFYLLSGFKRLYDDACYATTIFPVAYPSMPEKAIQIATNGGAITDMAVR